MTQISVSAILLACVFAGTLSADVSVEDRGAWPETWPKELTFLRETSRTIEGPLAEVLQYQIGFKTRKDFESTWPHILKVRTAEQPITLVRSPYVSPASGTSVKAGVIVNSVPTNFSQKKGEKQTIITTVVLVVDGDIVDLNRIRLPENMPIHDRRFKKQTRSDKRSTEDLDG